MKKKWIRMISAFMVFTMLFGSVVNVAATSTDQPADAASSDDMASDRQTDGEDAKTDEDAGGDQEAPKTDVPSNNQEAPTDQETSPNQGDLKDQSQNQGTETPSSETGSNDTETEQKDVSGDITMDEKADVSGTITVEEDEHDDNVEIKKNDKPYLALGQDLTTEQQSTVLALMGIDRSKLPDYDVVYINNAEEHQYLGTYIDKSKIGSKSLSSIVIVEREEGNGINISTNNITYCTVGMYKNALATAGIQNADISVAAPFPISGTAALVGVFKAYTEMTGDQIDEENIDAALNELVLTGKLEAGGAEADEVEGMIAYVKQAVVEHDLSDESEIRKAIQEGCEKFDITLTDEEMNEIVQLMLKISDLDLDLDGLLNAAQSIYDKIMTADSGFWAKIRELLITLWEKIKELF